MNIFTRIYYYFLYYAYQYFYSIEKKISFYDSDEEEDEKIDIITNIENLTKHDPEQVNKTLEIKDFVTLPETETTNFDEEKYDDLPDLISEEINQEAFYEEKKEDAIVLQKQESKDSIVLEKKASVKSEHIVDKKLSKKWWVCF